MKVRKFLKSCGTSNRQPGLTGTCGDVVSKDSSVVSRQDVAFQAVSVSTSDVIAAYAPKPAAEPAEAGRRTFEGAPAFQGLGPLAILRRSVLSCLLWEDEFYEGGESIAARIETFAALVSPGDLAALAVEARNGHHLRHVPLLLVACLAKKGGKIVSETIEKTIQRADEPGELLAIYWKNGKKPVSKQMKLGLTAALRKFDAYQLAKYAHAGTVRPRDVLFLTHAKPADEAQAALWKSLADDALPAPDTWEVELSAGKDKKVTFTRLIEQQKLGYLALLRNLRNMVVSGVDESLITRAILARRGARRVLPFRYVAAARACPRLEPALDQALAACLGESEAFSGRTIVLVDVSGSMNRQLSDRSDLTRMDAAATLAAIIGGERAIYTFSNAVVEVPPRNGMACIDAVVRSQSHGGTELANAVSCVNKLKHDRLIVITDEQASAEELPDPAVERAYMINVASYRNGVGYGKWTHIDGFSESVLRWIIAYEREFAMGD